MDVACRTWIVRAQLDLLWSRLVQSRQEAREWEPGQGDCA